RRPRRDRPRGPVPGQRRRLLRQRPDARRRRGPVDLAPGRAPPRRDVIYLVRHGQTEFNRERRIQGHVDSPLTELGVRQARAVGGLLADLIRDPAGWRIVSSPLGRARSTAEIVAGTLGGLPVELDDRLKEMSWGPHDGRLRAELEAEHPETFARTGWAFDASAGETYGEVCDRVGSWLAELPPEPQRRIIAVSHG